MSIPTFLVEVYLPINSKDICTIYYQSPNKWVRDKLLASPLLFPSALTVLAHYNKWNSPSFGSQILPFNHSSLIHYPPNK